MSLMRMSCPYVGTIDLKVTGFFSPLRGDIRSSQTKLAKHHYPIKASQQSMQLQVQFSSQSDYRAMQDFVRKHHVRSLSTVASPEATFYWPERNIDNWSGIITDFKAGQTRFVYAPKAQIDVLLIDSMLSQKTFTSSFGADYASFFETDIGDPVIVRPPILPPRPGDDGFIGPVSPIKPESPRGEGGTGGSIGGGGGNF